MSKEQSPFSEVSVIPIRPIRANDLIAPSQTPETGGLDIHNSMVYPFIIQEPIQSPYDLSIAAVINHPLRGQQLLHFLNRIAPVKKDLFGSLGEAQAAGVAADWAFMITTLAIQQERRNHLQNIHSPRNVPGFKEFIPHADLFLNSLEEMFIMRNYGIPQTGQFILPLVYFDINQDGLHWHDEVLKPDLSNKLKTALTKQVADTEKSWVHNNATLDTYAGMAVPAYTAPNSTNHWPRVINKQEMSLAQVPVLNWQYAQHQEHDTKPIVTELMAYVRGAISTMQSQN